MKDLTTKEGRVAAIKEIEDSFLQELREYYFSVAPNAVCDIN